MNIAEIKPITTENGNGCRVSVFVSGCNIHCDNCHNPELWDFNYGKPMREYDIISIIEMMKPDYIKGLTILGGEPLDSNNIESVYYLIDEIRKVYPVGTKDIWVYTGYKFESLYSPKAGHFITKNLIFCLIDKLVDGPYIDQLGDPLLANKGSKNQRIIDLSDFGNNSAGWWRHTDHIIG